MSQLFCERVSRGATWLDHAVGRWWHQYIDLGSLDISDTGNCVIGQVFGDFNAWRENVKTDVILRHGFDCLHRKDKNFNKLTNAWKSEIKKRLVA